MEEIYFKEDCREKLFNGIEKLSNAVGSTMGPNGKTVIILDDYNEPVVTKDGVSVARSIQFKDPVENAGASLIKQAAEKTLKDAGDGTTTSTVLANAFIKNLKDFDIIEVNKAFDEIIPKVINELKKNSRILKNEDIKYVASVSANNDIQIGELIQQAFDFSSIVKVEEGDEKDSIELIEGMKLDSSYFSKHFITNKNKGECELYEPYVLILQGKLEKLNSFTSLINRVYEENKSLLIITEDISEQSLKLLESSVLNNGAKLAVIKSPGVGGFRKELLRDIADFTGTIVTDTLSKTITISNLGKLKSCKISNKSALLLKDDNINLEDLTQSLKEFSTTLEDGYEKELINKRIENLTGKISVIKVGGLTPAELKERFDRYDDAVRAVTSALEEGIIEGGGVSLLKIWKNYLGFREDTNHSEVEIFIIRSLISPYQKIVENGTKFTKEIIENGSIVIPNNMFKKNIIDPLKVTRCALENAVSVAKTILSTDTIILNRNQWM